MGLQALIFDVDGTVAETADIHRVAFNRAFEAQGLGWHWDREIYSQLSPVEFTLPKLRLFSVASRRCGHGKVPDHAGLAKIAALKSKIYCQMLREGAAHLRPGVARLMKEALHEGLTLGAVSTSTRVETQALLTAVLGFENLSWITSLKTAGKVALHTAERSLYRAVLDDLGLEGHQAISRLLLRGPFWTRQRNGLPVLATPSMYTSSNQFESAALTLSDLGQPAEPFTAISGRAHGHAYVCPALLREIALPKAVAA